MSVRAVDLSVESNINEHRMEIPFLLRVESTASRYFLLSFM